MSGPLGTKELGANQQAVLAGDPAGEHNEFDAGLVRAIARDLSMSSDARAAARRWLEKYREAHPSTAREPLTEAEVKKLYEAREQGEKRARKRAEGSAPKPYTFGPKGDDAA